MLFGELGQREGSAFGSGEPSADPPAWGGGQTMSRKPKMTSVSSPLAVLSSGYREDGKVPLVTLLSCHCESGLTVPGFPNEPTTFLHASACQVRGQEGTEEALKEQGPQRGERNKKANDFCCLVIHCFLKSIILMTKVNHGL